MRRLRAVLGRESGEAGVAPFETKPAVRGFRERPMAQPGITAGTQAEVREAELAAQQSQPMPGRYAVCPRCQVAVRGEACEADIRLLRERLELMRAGYVNLARGLAAYLVDGRGLDVTDVLTSECSDEYLAEIGADRSIGRFSVLRLAMGPIAVLPAEASGPVPSPPGCPVCHDVLWLGPVAP